MLHLELQWISAAALAATVVAAAYRLRRLSLSGAVAAMILGTMIVGTGGWWPGIILVAFFVTSSLLSRSDTNQARGAMRDWVQVLANGWGMLLGCLLYAATNWEPWLLFGFGAIAAASADTWSSELGRRSTSPPRLVTSGKIVTAGTSGAVSVVGTMASVAGAALVGIIAYIAMASGTLHLNRHAFVVLLGVTLAGMAGGFVDSLLGATVQERRWCDLCNKATEANPHRCGAQTRQVGGIARFNNDVVNMICVLTGALVALVSGIL